MRVGEIVFASRDIILHQRVDKGQACEILQSFNGGAYFLVQFFDRQEATSLQKEALERGLSSGDKVFFVEDYRVDRNTTVPEGAFATVLRVYHDVQEAHERVIVKMDVTGIERHVRAKYLEVRSVTEQVDITTLSDLARLLRGENLKPGFTAIPPWFASVHGTFGFLSLSTVPQDALESILKAHMSYRAIDTVQDLVSNVTLGLPVCSTSPTLTTLKSRLENYRDALIKTWADMNDTPDMKSTYAALKAYAEVHDESGR